MVSNTTTVSVTLNKTVKERLNELAAQTERSEDELMAEAIEVYVELRDWQAEEIRRALREADAGGPFVAHEDIIRWVSSWGSENELPPPEATIWHRK